MSAEVPEKKKKFIFGRRLFAFMAFLFFPAILFIIVLVILFLTLLNSPIRYEIDFSKGFTNTSGFYILDSPQDSKFDSSLPASYPEVKNSPITAVWNPLFYPMNRDLEVSADFEDDSSWDISIQCPNCDPQSQYDWKPFYRGELKGYQLLKDFDEVNIYAPKSFVSIEDSGDQTQWFKSNLKETSTVKILDNSITSSVFESEKVDYLSGSSTTIANTFRGPVNFYLYLKDKFELSLIKKDLNWYEGGDEVEVSLLGLDNTIILKETINDDGQAGIVEGSTAIEKTFSAEIQKAGVYKLTFDGNTDWTITNLKFNTNKVVISDKVLIIDPSILYLNPRTQREITFNAWLRTAIQTVKIKGASIADVNIDASSLGYDITHELNPGEYTIESNGNFFMDAGIFSFSKESYFEPFIVDLNLKSKKEPDFVISDTNIISNIAKVTFKSSDLSKLSNLREIKFVLKNRLVEKKYNSEKSLATEGYTKLNSFENYQIWQQENKGSADLKDVKTLNDYILKSLPPYSTLYVDSRIKINSTDFQSDIPEGFKSEVTLFNLNLRGSHEFFIYSTPSLNIEISKEDLNNYDGSDQVNFQIKDLNGNIICSKEIKDDQNNSANQQHGFVIDSIDCPLGKSGVYTLSLQEAIPQGQEDKSDFVFNYIKLNTNKLIIKDKIFPTKNQSVYTRNPEKKNINILYWLAESKQTIAIKDAQGTETQIQLGSTDLGKDKLVSLVPGEKIITIPTGNLIISGVNFALSKENWFDVYKINIAGEKDLNPAYKLILDEKPSKSFIKTLTLEIK